MKLTIPNLGREIIRREEAEYISYEVYQYQIEAVLKHLFDILVEHTWYEIFTFIFQQVERARKRKEKSRAGTGRKE